MRLLITGGAGFIGSNFIRYMLEKYPDYEIVNLDKLTYAGNLDNLLDVDEKYGGKPNINPPAIYGTSPLKGDGNKGRYKFKIVQTQFPCLSRQAERDCGGKARYKFVKGDIGDFERNKKLLKDEKIDVVVNFAAESHNGRAMVEPDIFVKTNVLGTQMLLEAAREAGVKRFHHISTCEVFGDLELDEDRSFKEDDPYMPKTPYNASKAGANHEVMAYYHTFKLPVTISHCANNFGPCQFPEKVIPRFITSAMQDQELPLFKSSQNMREWLHTKDHCNAIDLIIHKGKAGESYNIGSGVEKSVEEIADAVLTRLSKPKSLKIYVEDRPGHDKRYLLDTGKIESELNWKHEIDFEKGMDEIVDWYVNNEWWWRPLLGKGFVENYTKI